jgi:RNA polymerase sigma factor (sigma-70 family)
MDMGPLSKVVRRTLLKLGGAASLTDGELLRRFIGQQDQAAFAEIVARHGPMVLRVCQRVLRHTQDAEDAFQATFVVLARKAELAAAKESVGGWLHCVACRTAWYAHRTRAGRMHARRMPLPSDPVPAVSSAQTDDDADVWALLDHELHQLPQKYRSAMVLHYLEGKTVAETARELGCQTSALKMRLQTARERLRGRLARRGVILSAPALAALLAQDASAMALPVALVTPVIEAAKYLEAGQGLSPSVGGLAEVVLRDMARRRVLRWAGVLAVLLIGAGAGVLFQSGRTGPPKHTEPRVLANMWQLLRTLPGHKEPVGYLQFSSEGGTLVSAYSREGGLTAREGNLVVIPTMHDVKRWQTASGAEIPTAQLAKWKDELPKPGCISPDLRTHASWSIRANGVGDGAIHVWDVRTDDAAAMRLSYQRLITQVQSRWSIKPRTTLAGHRDGVVSAEFSADGGLLASAGTDGTVTLWDAMSGKELVKLRGANPLQPLTFSPDAKKLLCLTWSRTQGSVKPTYALELWDSITGKKSGDFGIRPGDIPFSGSDCESRPAFSPDGQTLALCIKRIDERGRKWVKSGTECWASFWDVTTRKELVLEGVDPSQTTSVAFSRDGQMLALGRWDGMIKVWKLDVAK